jgi:hypothetical protein
MEEEMCGPTPTRVLQNLITAAVSVHAKALAIDASFPMIAGTYALLLLHPRLPDLGF